MSLNAQKNRVEYVLTTLRSLTQIVEVTEKNAIKNLCQKNTLIESFHIFNNVLNGVTILVHKKDGGLFYNPNIYEVWIGLGLDNTDRYLDILALQAKSLEPVSAPVSVVSSEPSLRKNFV